ncbi:MAG: tail fiber assembly protein [Plesiomonas shigelloides]
MDLLGLGIEMTYFFSSSTNAFYPSELKDSYVSANSWPLDAVEVSDEAAEKFMGEPPTGQVRAGDSNGMPTWIPSPPPSSDELVGMAEEKKANLQRESEDAIKPLERAKSLGIATPQELSLLTEWEKYSVYLMRVDTSKPDQIVWPTKPQ